MKNRIKQLEVNNNKKNKFHLFIILLKGQAWNGWHGLYWPWIAGTITESKKKKKEKKKQTKNNKPTILIERARRWKDNLSTRRTI